MLEDPGKEGGEGDEAVGNEAGRSDQWGEEGGAQGSGGEKQESIQPESRRHTTSQEGREVWGQGVGPSAGGGGQGGGRDTPVGDFDTTDIVEKTVNDRELYTVLYTNACRF